MEKYKKQQPPWRFGSQSIVVPKMMKCAFRSSTCISNALEIRNANKTKTQNTERRNLKHQNTILRDFRISNNTSYLSITAETITDLALCLHHELYSPSHSGMCFVSYYTVKDYSFQTGVNFNYHDKHLNGVVHPHSWLNGSHESTEYTPEQLYVPPHFNSLKEEVLQSGAIAQDIWLSKVVGKAKKLSCAKFVRKIIAKAAPHLASDIIIGSVITEQHLCAVILWCDYSQFCTLFAESFRKLEGFETLEDLKSRNSRYHHMSKLLMEAVQHFGKCLDDEFEDAEDRSKTFWCGMGFKLKVSDFLLVPNLPFSGTLAKECAWRFAGENGIVLRFDIDGNKTDKGSHYSSKTRFFDATKISSWVEELPYIFFGGKYPLRLGSVTVASTCITYAKFCDALFAFDCMISGRRPVGNFKKSEDVEDIVVTIEATIKNRRDVGAAFSTNNGLDNYTKECFAALCMVREAVHLNLWSLERLFPESLWKLVVSNVRKNVSASDVSQDPSLNMPVVSLLNLFDNVKNLVIYTSSCRGTTSYRLNVEALIMEISKKTSELPFGFVSVIIKARMWTKPGGDYHFDDYSSDDDEPLTPNAQQQEYGQKKFRSWIDELWQRSAESLKSTAGKWLSGWSISHEIAGRVPKGSKEGNEDHLVIRKIVVQQEKSEPELCLGISKAYPGDCFKDKFPNKQDARGEPAVIKFKWNKDCKTFAQCDTQHMLYLLQCACELHRKRVIQRNKYFESISRSDRYIEHVDTPQFITNFVKWHDEVKDNNLFTGKMLETKEPDYLIGKIAEIGDVKRGSAIRIYHKLKNEVEFEYDQWRERSNTYTKLNLETWGLYKMYANEKVLEECTVEDIVTLFTFVNESENKEDYDENDVDSRGNILAEVRVNGVFAQFEEQTAKGNVEMRQIDGWKEKTVKWVREQQVNGKKLIENYCEDVEVRRAFKKHVVNALRIKLEPNDEKAAKRLNGPTGRMLNICKKMPVHKVLEAAKIQGR